MKCGLHLIRGIIRFLTARVAIVSVGSSHSICPPLNSTKSRVASNNNVDLPNCAPVQSVISRA